MNKEWEDVKQFHLHFAHPVGEATTMLMPKRTLARAKWMSEEVLEFVQANDIYEQADAMIDLIYFALGTLVEMGIEPDELFKIVHQANMAKLGEDGKPLFNHEGKTIKPAHWEDPFPKIKTLIDSMADKSK